MTDRAAAEQRVPACSRIECQLAVRLAETRREERDTAWAKHDAARAELGRWKNLAEGWHKHHNEALDARDAARAERDEARAELDRQRALIAAVLAECERVERGPGKFNVMATFEIRDLLGGEKKS